MCNNKSIQYFEYNQQKKPYINFFYIVLCFINLAISEHFNSTHERK